MDRKSRSLSWTEYRKEDSRLFERVEITSDPYESSTSETPWYARDDYLMVPADDGARLLLRDRRRERTSEERSAARASAASLLTYKRSRRADLQDPVPYPQSTPTEASSWYSRQTSRPYLSFEDDDLMYMGSGLVEKERYEPQEESQMFTDFVGPASRDVHDTPVELRVLHDGGHEPMCDIVFVHGWNGGIERTWQSGKVLWPRDLLPRDFESARILAYGYQSPLIHNARLGSVNHVAEDLLHSLVRKRTGHALSRPIVWVAHSLGGLIVKSALAIADSNRSFDPIQETIIDFTRGVIFFGTPHQEARMQHHVLAMFINMMEYGSEYSHIASNGSTRSAWQTMLQKIFSVAGAPSPATAVLLDQLRAESEQFRTLHDNFTLLVEKSRLSIFSFFESRAMTTMPISTLVTDKSSAMNHRFETVKVLHGNHNTMCKFQDQSESAYIVFKAALDRLVSPVIIMNSGSADSPLSFVPSHRHAQELLHEITPIGLLRSEVDSRTVITEMKPLVSDQRKLRFVKQLLRMPLKASKYIPARNLGSCEWVKDTPEYRNWLKHGKILSITGFSGSGKSVIAHYIASELLPQHADALNAHDEISQVSTDDAGAHSHTDQARSGLPYVLHFYFSSQITDLGCTKYMLLSLLNQLVDIEASLVRHFPSPDDEMSLAQNTIPADMKSPSRWLDHEAHGDKDSSKHGIPVLGIADHIDFADPHEPEIEAMDVAELNEILLSILHDRDVPDVRFIIDGVDECSDLERFLDIVHSLMEVPSVKLCLTFVPKIGIGEKLHDLAGRAVGMIDVPNHPGHKQDVTAYSLKLINSINKQSNLTPSHCASITNLLDPTQKSAYLTMKLFQALLTGLDTQEEITSFLRGIEGDTTKLGGQGGPRLQLETVYKQAYKVLRQQRDASRLLALFFVAYSERPLSVNELSDLLTVSKTLKNAPLFHTDFIAWIQASFDRENSSQELDSMEALRRAEIRDMHVWLESKLFGLVVIKNNIVTTVHPTLTAYLKSTEAVAHTHTTKRVNFVQAVHKEFAAACIELLCIPRREKIFIQHGHITHDPYIEPMKYAAEHWGSHARMAGNHEILTLEPALKEMWRNRQLRSILLPLARRKSPSPKLLENLDTRLMLEHVLAAFDLPALMHLEAMIAVNSSSLGWTIRFAAANKALNVLKAASTVRPELMTGTDEHSRTVLDYAIWTQSRGFALAVEELVGRGSTFDETKKKLDAFEVVERGSLDSDRLKRTISDRTVVVTVMHQAIISMNQQLVEQTLAAVSDPKRAKECVDAAILLNHRRLVHRMVQSYFVKLSIDYSSTLKLAAKRADKKLVQMLLEKDADPNYSKTGEASALHYAAHGGRLDICRMLVEWRARVTATDKKGRKPIHWAAERGHSDIVEFLMAPSNDRDDKGVTSLHLACNSRSITTVKVLLDYGSYISSADYTGRTPLHVASANGTEDIVRLLVAAGASLSNRQIDGLSKRPVSHSRLKTTPLHEAAYGGWTPIVQTLLEAGSDLEAHDKHRQTPLHYACRSLNPSAELAALLLDHHARLDALDDQGKTPCHLAAQYADVSVIRQLMDHPAHAKLLNTKDKQGYTLLHCAVEGNNLPVVNMLLQVFHASIDTKNSAGETALHLAVRKSKRRILMALLQHIESVDSSSSDGKGNTLLHLAIATKVDRLEKLDSLIAKSPRLITLAGHINRGELSLAKPFFEIVCQSNTQGASIIDLARGNEALRTTLDHHHQEGSSAETSIWGAWQTMKRESDVRPSKELSDFWIALRKIAPLVRAYEKRAKKLGKGE